MVDFTPSLEQNDIRGMVKSFADKVLSTAAATNGRYPTQKERFQPLRPFYRKAVEGGLVRRRSGSSSPLRNGYKNPSC
jgi:hypothetical protein